MSFINNCSTIIRRSNKDMFHIYNNNGIYLDIFDKNNSLRNSKKVFDSSIIDFTKTYFTLDKSDNIYGICSNNNLTLLEMLNDSNEFSKNEIIKYNNTKFNILFPYIKILNDNIHIIYYVYNNSSTNTTALFHHYRCNNVWMENKIDFINHIILDDFIVLWSQNSPILFYFNLVDGFEEVFMSRFNCSTLTWSSPVQITNSKKSKLYLSVLKDSMNFYHITFCENIENGYAVKYINGYLNENSLDVNISTYISGPSTCMYPTLIKYKSTLYLMWVNYGKLITSFSTDLGKSWNEHKIDDFSIEEDFARAKFISNYKEDLPYNLNSVFTTCSEIGLLGF